MILGVDISGSHITAQLVDVVKKEVLADSYVRVKLDTFAQSDEIIRIWAETINSSLKHSPIKVSNIAIAMPGPMDYRTGICKIRDQGKYASLYGKNIKEALAAAVDFPLESIKLFNDAASFLKGELFAGSISEFGEAIGLTFGTGLGTAHTVNGKAKDSGFWKMPFLDGIAEDYISTRWFVARFKELTGNDLVDVRDLVEHHQNNPAFTEIFDEFSKNLALFLYKFIRKKMPYAAVIGGNIANAEGFFLDDTRRYLAEHMGYSFPIRKSALADQATILGAVANTLK